MIKLSLAPLQWMGSNAILFYVFSDSGGVLTWLVTILSWGRPHGKKNLVYFFQEMLAHGFGCAEFLSCVPALVTYTAIQLVFWFAVCGFLHRKGLIWKI